MSRLLISTALAGLLAATSAFAQDDHHGGGGGDRGRGGPPASPAAAAPQAPHGPGPGAGMRGPGPGMHGNDHRGPSPAAAPAPAPAQAAPAAARTDNNRRPDDRRSNGPGRFNNSPNNGPAAAPQNNRGAGGPRFNGSNRPGGQRPDFSAFHRNFSAPRHFHAPSYRRPSGWYAHRWTFGEVLPSLFWAQDYWIDDFGDYSLAPPPPGTVWVRDGDDALLIDRYSGEIIEVEYGVFF